MTLLNVVRCLYKNKIAPPLIHKIVVPASPQPSFAQNQVRNLAYLEQGVSLNSNPCPNFMLEELNRLQTNQQASDTHRKTDALIQMMMLALQSGNINLAMLIFSSLETSQANEITKTLGQKLLQVQNERRQLTSNLAQIQGQKENNQAQMTQIQSNLQEVNDTLQMLTTFIKDIQDQKNRTVEFANNFLNSEHQTTMSVVRGMRG